MDELISVSPNSAQQIHAWIRSLIAIQLSDGLAQKMRILYGGGVNPDNAAALVTMPGIGGGLVEKASFSGSTFLNVCHTLIELCYRLL